jgi:glycogen operon protein
MLCGGDEIGRTQRGNNNAYCQDNEISWSDWEHADQALLGFTRDLIRLRRAHPVFCRRRWFQGRPIRGSKVADIGWFTPEGKEMSDENWQAGFAKSLAVFLNGNAIPSPDPKGQRIVDDSFYVMFNAHHEPLEFVMPEAKWGECWSIVLDTNEASNRVECGGHGRELTAGERVKVPAWTMVLLQNAAPSPASA